MNQAITTTLYNEHLYKGEQFLSEWALIGGIGPAARASVDLPILVNLTPIVLCRSHVPRRRGGGIAPVPRASLYLSFPVNLTPIVLCLSHSPRLRRVES